MPREGIGLGAFSFEGFTLNPKPSEGSSLTASSFRFGEVGSRAGWSTFYKDIIGFDKDFIGLHKDMIALL